MHQLRWWRAVGRSVTSGLDEVQMHLKDPVDHADDADWIVVHCQEGMMLEGR